MTALVERQRIGLTPDEARRHAEAARRRHTRERVARMVDERIDLLAGLIGRLTVHIETCRGDVGPQVREKWSLVVEMDRLMRWRERQGTR